MAKDEKTPAQKEMDKIYKGQEIADVTKTAYQLFHENLPGEIKQEIIKEKGMVEGVKYLNSEDGIKYMADNLLSRTADKARKRVKSMDEWEQNMYIANFIPEEQRLLQGLQEAGAKYHDGIHLDVLSPQIKTNDRAANTSILNFDKSPNMLEGILKELDKNKRLQSYEGITPAQTASLVSMYNKGGTPIGDDAYKRVGLESKLKK